MGLEAGAKVNTGDSRARRNFPIVITASRAARMAVGTWFGGNVILRSRGSACSYGGIHEFWEKEPLRSPSALAGQIRSAFGIAREMPEILDQPYSYCECDKHLYTHTQRSCFVDSHAATRLTICQGKALDAPPMAKKGYGRDEIHPYVHHKYSRA